MKSMTGYGSGSAAREGSSLLLEIRSVNHKQRDIRCTLPGDLAAAESELQAFLGRRIQRGAVSVTVKFQPSAELKGSSLNIDAQLLAQAAGKLRRIAAELGVPDSFDLNTLLALPGMVSVSGTSVPPEMALAMILEAAEKACTIYDGDRMREGEHLRADLAAHGAAMEELLRSMSEKQDEMLVHYRDRLVERIRVLDVEVRLDDERLAKEVAFAAQRSDISEELTRLLAHLQQFASLLGKTDEAVGRTLQFLCQEIHREINTLCSKASETAVARAGIQFKTILEKVREQIANVE